MPVVGEIESALISSREERRKKWPSAARLQDKHIQNCKLVPHRTELLNRLPKQAICAELGILKGEFSQKILESTSPTRLHLIDTHNAHLEAARQRFSAEVERGQVHLHFGKSWEKMATFSDGYFDWVYIDACHCYECVSRDLEVTRHKIRANGLIVLNDYIYFAPMDFKKYGVVEATNEFCLRHNFEMVFMALHGRTYNDVVLRALPRSE